MDLKLIAIVAIDAIGEPLLASLGSERGMFRRRQPDPLADDHRRRPAMAGNFGLPRNAALRAPCCRQVLYCARAVAAGAAELEPIAGGDGAQLRQVERRSQRKQQRQRTQYHDCSLSRRAGTVYAGAATGFVSGAYAS